MNRQHVVTVSLTWLFIAVVTALLLLLSGRTDATILALLASSPGVALLFSVSKFPPAPGRDPAIVINNYNYHDNSRIEVASPVAGGNYLNDGYVSAQQSYYLPLRQAPEPEYIQYEGEWLTIPELNRLMEKQEQEIQELEWKLAQEARLNPPPTYYQIAPASTVAQSDQIIDVVPVKKFLPPPATSQR